MRILIIEDEFYAAKRLKSMVLDELPEASILDVLDTVEDSIAWLSSHVEPNLIFCDIQLADGLSFQIFEKIQVKCPIIFTTAYDEYALNAFKVNSIDYLLKPIEQVAMQKAIKKYQEFFPQGNPSDFNWKNITHEMFNPRGQFKQRFLIKKGNSYSYLNCTDIQLLFSEDGLSFCLDKEQRRHLIDKSLDTIEKELDPNAFFRISRKHVVALDSVKKAHAYLNSRLKLELNIPMEEELIVSREKVKKFKDWLDS